MAEHLNQTPPPRQTKEGSGDGLDAMGKPVPLYRRTAALEHCKAMGLTDPEDAWACVGGMSEQLERDQPYEAQAVGMRYLDLTGTYRLMAVLLTTKEPSNATQRNSTSPR
jgi:hypothetical protein